MDDELTDRHAGSYFITSYISWHYFDNLMTSLWHYYHTMPCIQAVTHLGCVKHLNAVL